MANNLINGNSFNFVEGMEKSEIEQEIEKSNSATLLWSNSNGETSRLGDTLTLSEDYTNFRQLVFYSGDSMTCVVSVGGVKGPGPWIGGAGSAATIDLTGAEIGEYNGHDVLHVPHRVVKVKALSTTSLLIDKAVTQTTTPYLLIDPTELTVRVFTSGTVNPQNKFNAILGIGRISG